MVHTTFHPDLKSSLGKYTPKSFLFSLVANSVLLHIPRNYDFSLFMSNKKKISERKSFEILKPKSWTWRME